MPRVRTDSSVFIGDKPVMTYVFEVAAQLNSGAPEVRIKARGQAIARAVDVAEIARRHKLVEVRVQVARVQIGTERLTNREGRDSNVSFIEIVLSREGERPSPAAPPGPATPKTASPTPAGSGEGAAASTSPSPATPGSAPTE